MSNNNPNLRLIEDPACAVIWILNQLPPETCVTYLGLVLAYSVEKGITSLEEYSRIKSLVDDILSDEVHRAA
jgi:hypothetical protein